MISVAFEHSVLHVLLAMLFCCNAMKFPVDDRLTLLLLNTYDALCVAFEDV